MKMYVACKLEQIERARQMRDELIKRGHEVTSKWLDRQHVPPITIDDYYEIGITNQEDVERADCVVALISPQIRGTLVEVGLGIGLRKKVFLCGNKPSVTPMLALRGAIWLEQDIEIFDYL